VNKDRRASSPSPGGRRQFPVIWGAATSAHQVEGGNQWNDWWAWEKAGRVGQASGAASDHYRRFREDFRLARSLGHTAHRFSLEWSRLEPDEGRWNEEAFRHYDEVFDALASEGLEPVVTLHHFTNPAWFAEQGGWLAPHAAEKFAAYVQRVAERYGRKARFWITLNEPLIYIYQGFLLGRWPPGEQSVEKGFRVLREFVQAHLSAYQILHEGSKGSECWVSIANHMTAFSPCRRNSVLDRLNLFSRNWFVNHLLFRALLSGFLFYPGIFSEKLPAARTLDFLGVNYYSRDFVRFAGFWGVQQFGTVCSKDHHPGEVGELNDLGWEVYPKGIYEMISSLRGFGLPILVTENGISTGDDRQRERYIEAHLKELGRAREEGAAIFGYFYWSLVDNFEWADGFRPRFGIVEVDYANQARRVRASAQTLSKACETILGKGHAGRTIPDIRGPGGGF